MTNTSYYAKLISSALERLGRSGYDLGQVEAWMRLEHSTLDALAFGQFDYEVEQACRCIDADPVASELLAASEGLA